MIRFKKENPHRDCTRIKDYIIHLGYKIGETTVKNILLENGYDSEPDLTRKTTWPRSPNLDAHAERFVRSVREECLGGLLKPYHRKAA